MEVVTAILGKIWDCSFDATCRQFRYLCSYKDSFKRLRIKAETLKYRRERVQGKIDEAIRNGEIIQSDVTNWIQRVDDTTKEAERFTENEDQANKRCLKGMCIDPWSCYRFGKEAERKIEAISILQQEGAEFEGVSRQAPPPSNLLIIPWSALSINFKSRELVTRQIMETLKDENVSIIGICGMDGVGKTTLAKEISKQARENRLFYTVVMVVVSQTQSYVNIQRDIAKRSCFNDCCVEFRKLADKEESWMLLLPMMKTKQTRSASKGGASFQIMLPVQQGSTEEDRAIEEISLLLAKVGDFEAVSHPHPTLDSFVG
ncbi:hypothetical protein Ddye_018547 [Dipteronia dyeriana]|uniref:NB-ARC domain-containing protein n=1 Tax=Dipteronia dyeriana TaxID=168575 RepID=A0AAD9UB89_9ROSI|nr:hypothetical protein Ddye_018547 [Dipteronia dyeriana]